MKYSPMNRNYSLFDDVFDDFITPVFNDNNTLKTNVHEKDENYILDVEVPGYDKNDIKLELKDGYLKISANHNETNEEKDAKGHIIRQERSFGSCSRSFYVGDNISENDIKAKYNNGILNIVLPNNKACINAPKTINID